MRRNRSTCLRIPVLVYSCDKARDARCTWRASRIVILVGLCGFSPLTTLGAGRENEY